MSSVDKEVHLDKPRERDGYEAGELYKGIIKKGAKFIYEDYIIKLIYTDNESFRKVYDKLEQVDYLNLSITIEEIIQNITLIAVKKRFI